MKVKVNKHNNDEKMKKNELITREEKRSKKNKVEVVEDVINCLFTLSATTMKPHVSWFRAAVARPAF